jgi:hypothetical protein
MSQAAFSDTKTSKRRNSGYLPRCMTGSTKGRDNRLSKLLAFESFYNDGKRAAAHPNYKMHYDELIITLSTMAAGTLAHPLLRGGERFAPMPIHSCMQPGAFEPEAIAAMSEALEVVEALARRIIAAARLGERNPVRLREAALRKPD